MLLVALPAGAQDVPQVLWTLQAHGHSGSGVDRALDITSTADGALGQGAHVLHWDGRDSAGRRVAPGVYLARLVAGGELRSRKLVLLG